jgi:methylmalonyl-CoA/ethylmalonyl-CoA epimerase
VDLRFHHVGLACRDIEVERRAHRLLGYIADGPDFVDPQQRIRGCFLTHGGMRIELLEPAADDSPLEPFIARGLKMYHQAFETSSIEASIEELQAAGAALAVPPTPAVAFAMRPIAFLMLRTTMLVELVQAAPGDDTAAPQAPRVAAAPGPSRWREAIREFVDKRRER